MGVSGWRLWAKSSEASFTHIWWLMLNVMWVPISSLCGPLHVISPHGLCVTFSLHSSAVLRSSILRERTRWKFYHLFWPRLWGYFCFTLLDEVNHRGWPISKRREQNPSRITLEEVSASFWKKAMWEGIYWCGHLWKI